MLGTGVFCLLLSLAVAVPANGRQPRYTNPDSYWGKEDCGGSSYDDAGREPPETHVVNGWEARQHEFPYLVSVKSNGRHVCQGNILNANTILTVAHCIDSQFPRNITYVGVGEHSLQVPNPNTALYAVSDVIVHPDYDTASVDYDIAILKLAYDIHFDVGAQPVCPPSRTRDGYVGLLTTVTGWGWNGVEFPDVLHAVNVPVWEFERCQGLLEEVQDGMICAADNDVARDSCVRDSGSGLAWKNEEGRFELVGLVSWGRDCGDPIYPGVYTDVEYYGAWIDSNM